jgi:hypothetical protein
MVSAARPPNIKHSNTNIEHEEIDVKINFSRILVYLDFKEIKMPNGGSKTISAMSMRMRRPAISPSNGLI